MGTSLGHELSEEPIQLRAPGRGPEGPNQGERQVGKAPAQLAKAEKGGWIGPVKVLHRQNHRRRQAEPLHERQHGLQDPEPERRRVGKCQGAAPNSFAVSDEQVADLRSLRVRRCRVKVQGLHQRPKGPVALQLRGRSDIGLEAKPRARCRTSVTSRDLPIPASPSMRPTWHGPSAARRSSSSREATSEVRPTKDRVPGDGAIIEGDRR